MALQNIRSNTSHKRPTASGLSDGQIAINTNADSPGLFFKDAGGALIKVGPVHIGTSAPNSVPAGSSGNAIGEQWLDTSNSGYVFKIWDGTAWRSETGQFVDVAGDTMTGNLTISGADLIMSNGEIVAETGSAATPSITFTGDTNTGLYSPGANQVALSTNGTGRLFVAADGDIGINTSAPRSAGSNFKNFEIVGDSVDRGGAILLSSSDDSRRALNYLTDTYVIATATNHPIAFETNNTERLRITSAGLVGIGTSSPDSLLEVRDSLATGIISRASNTQGTNTNKALRVRNNSDTDTFTVSYRGQGYFADSVGIGTTSPGQPLTIAGANPQIGLPDGAGNTATIGVAQGGGGIGNLIITGIASKNITFNSPSSEFARIDSSGRLLVGTSTSVSPFNSSCQVVGDGTSAVARFLNSGGGPIFYLGKSRGTAVGEFTIVQSDDELGQVEFWGTDGSTFRRGARIAAFVDGTPGANDMPGRLVFSTTADGASNPTERMRISSDGSTLFSNPFYLNSKTVNGTSNAIKFESGDIVSSRISTANQGHIKFVNGNGQVGQITTNGSATSYITSSDYRLKENVTPVTDGITRLQQLKPSRFNFIADPDTVVDGFLAHEVQTIVPEAITGEKDAVDDEGNPEYQGIDQSKIVPLLTAALQEALAKIETLEQRLTDAGL